ncbi:hypothetical protein AVEN_59575-1, partial [Araneus ventricosus]
LFFYFHIPCVCKRSFRTMSTDKYLVSKEDDDEKEEDDDDGENDSQVKISNNDAFEGFSKGLAWLEQLDSAIPLN